MVKDTHVDGSLIKGPQMMRLGLIEIETTTFLKLDTHVVENHGGCH